MKESDENDLNQQCTFEEEPIKDFPDKMEGIQFEMRRREGKQDNLDHLLSDSEAETIDQQQEIQETTNGSIVFYPEYVENALE